MDAVVTMDVTDYIEKNWNTINKEHYHQLSKDQTTANNETADNVIERFQKKNLIIKNVAEELKTVHLGHLDSIFNLKYINKIILEDQ